MDYEVNVNSSLAGVELRIWERGRTTIIRSLPEWNEEAKTGRNFYKQKAKREGYGQGRKCGKCGKPLSVYNPGVWCLCHDED